MTDDTGTLHIQGYCGLCIARCGTLATVAGGRFTRLDPDPSHPTGHAICAKGRAAPELVYHPERLTHPLRRTRPKGDSDPGWQRIGWDEASPWSSCAPPRGGVRLPLQTRHTKHAEPDGTGGPRGFSTPSRKVELYSQTFLDHGYAPLPEFVEPPIGPVARPDLTARFPLILTSAKSPLFCQTQSARRRLGWLRNMFDRGRPSSATAKRDC
jgi:anaerobic selenocysteine-containing dehydrogenase